MFRTFSQRRSHFTDHRLLDFVVQALQVEILGFVQKYVPVYLLERALLSLQDPYDLPFLGAYVAKMDFVVESELFVNFLEHFLDSRRQVERRKVKDDVGCQQPDRLSLSLQNVLLLESAILSEHPLHFPVHLELGFPEVSVLGVCGLSASLPIRFNIEYMSEYCRRSLMIPMKLTVLTLGGRKSTENVLIRFGKNGSNLASLLVKMNAFKLRSFFSIW